MKDVGTFLECGGKRSAMPLSPPQRSASPVESLHTPILHDSHTPIRHSSSAGFSLLEVLIALTVFTIGAGGMLTALGNHLRNVSFMEDQARAVRIASREISALRQQSEVEEMPVDGAEGRFSWVAEMASDELADWPVLASLEEELPALLTVTVRWSDVEGGEPGHLVRLKGLDVFE